MENVSLLDYENLMAIVDTISSDGYMYIIAGYDPHHRTLVMESAITKDQFNNLCMFVDETDAIIDYMTGNEFYKLNLEKIKRTGAQISINLPEYIMDLLWYIEKIKSD